MPPSTALLIGSTNARPLRRSPAVVEKILRTFTRDRDVILRDGKPAHTTRHTKGYRLVHIGTFDGRKVKWRYARLLWFLAHPNDPMPPMLDHVNGIVDDDRLANLRPCTVSQNSLNSKRNARGRANGLPRGVEKKGNRFRAWVSVDGKTKKLGHYATEEEAGVVAREAREKLAGAFLPGPGRYRIRKRVKSGGGCPSVGCCTP